MGKVQSFLAKPSTVLRCLGKYSFWVILVLSIPAFMSLFVPGFYGASDDIHIAWLHQMDAALRSGQFPPRFVPDLSFGFGYPLFNFVFPLPFYIGEIFHLLGLTLVDSVKAVFILSVPLSGYFMYRFLKEYVSEILAVASGILYIYTPYRATDIFVRGAMGEILAFVFPPLIAWSLVRIVKKGGIKWIAILGFSTAGLLMSHNIMAYMFFPFLAILALVLFFSAGTPRFPSFLKIISGFTLGLLISLFFWLPAITESGLMKYDTVFNFSDHFPTLRQLITPYFGYGASVPGPGDGMSFFIGTVNLVLVLGAILIFVLWRKKIDRNKQPLFVWAFGTFLIAVFMMNFRSVPVWNVIPFLPYFQFPWRFLSLVAFVTPVFIVSLPKIKFSDYFGIAIIILAIALNFGDFRPQDFLGRTDAYYINRYIPIPVASADYLKTGEEYLRLPKVTEKRPDKNYPLIVATGGLVKNLNTLNTLDGKFDTEAKGEVAVSYSKYLFPGWQVKVDGQNVAIAPGKPFGQIVFSVPSGSHSVEVKFGETPFRKVLDIVSLLSVLGAATIVLVKPKQFSSSKQKTTCVSK